MSTAHFRLRGDVAADADLLGLWEPRPAAAAFSAESAGEPALIWQVDLPAEPAAARAALRRQQAAVAASAAALAEAGERLARVRPGAAAFAAGGPEAALLADLMVLGVPAGGAPVGAESFGLLDRVRLPTGWGDDVAAFRTFMDQQLRLLRPTVTVETLREGSPAARTTFDVDGDCRSLLRAADAGLGVLHTGSVVTVLDSRRALLQLVGQVGAGAAGLAARFSLPGGAVTALPAALRYIRTVLDQARRVAAPAP